MICPGGGYKSIVQAVRNDLAGRFIDENRQPFYDGKGNIIQSHFGDNAIAFHAPIICPWMETFAEQKLQKKSDSHLAAIDSFMSVVQR